MSSKYNVDLMLEVKHAIENDPSAHDQMYWVRSRTCGTTMCIAGWAVHLAGKHEFKFDYSHDGSLTVDYVRTPEGHSLVPDVAADLLGLDEDESYRIFWTQDNEAAMGMLDELIEKGKNQ
jgi:hypothetical protein